VTDPRVTGLLLAGGMSSRMGADKAGLEFQGEPLARRVAAVLGRVAERVVVASGDGRRLAWLGLEQVPDAIPMAGPLSGIVAGLEGVGTTLVAVAAGDMPFASDSVFRLLVGRWTGEDAVVPVSSRGHEPLHAVYAARAAPEIRARLEQGERSVLRCLDGLRVREVPPDQWTTVDPAGAFAHNLNRPEDLPP